MNAGETPSLSIVIPTYNAEATLGQQLEALLASVDDDMEILVVDNRSTDDSRSVADRFAIRDRRVRVIDASARQGEPHARNVGVAAATSDRIAFCDADDVVAPTWASAMRDALGEHPFVTGPVELDQLNPPWLAGMRGRALFSSIPHTVNDIPFAHGCNFGVRREIGQQVGWDEAVRIGVDVIFAIRLHELGIEPAWAELAVVHYRHRARARERWRQAMSYGRATTEIKRCVGLANPLHQRVRSQARRIVWLARTSPLVMRRATRARWCFTLATVIGEIWGAEQ